MRVRILLVLLAALPWAAGEARGAGAWSTYLRADSFTDLLAENDTVWCATGQAGLLRYDRITQRFDSFTREPGGLASNNLTALARDRSGRLWVGTNGAGASRLAADESRWDLVNSFDGLRSDIITCLTALGDTVWIGTTAGITLWDGRQVVGSLPDGVNPSPFLSDNITGLIQHGDSLWVSTTNGIYVSRISTGLALWNQAPAVQYPPNNFSALATDGVALFTLTSNGSVLRRTFDSGGTWLIPSSTPIGTVLRLVSDRGTVLVTTPSGVFRWTGSDWANLAPGFGSDPSDPAFVFSASLDTQGRGYVARYQGLAEQSAAGGTYSAFRYPPGPPGNSITNLSLEGSRVYVSTFSEGVARLDNDQWRYWYPVPCVGTGCDTTFTSPVFSFALLVDSQGFKWFGMWQGAIERLNDHVDPPQVIHDYYSPPPRDLRTNAWASAEDSVMVGGVPYHGRWFGMDTNDFGNPERTPLGLVYYSGSGRDSLNFRQDSLPSMTGTKVHGLAVDRTGKVWVGYTDKGLQTFEWPPFGTSVVFDTVRGAADFDVQGIAALHDSVYVMTTRDVRIYNRSNAAFRDSVLLPAVPAQRAVRPLAVAHDRTIYVGTTNGMRVRHADGSIEDFTTTNSPLANNAVHAIQVDPQTGAVWIGTASGMNRYDPGYQPPPPPPVPVLTYSLYPNPAVLTALGIQLRINGNATRYQGAIFDLTGRRVHQFDVSGNRSVVWNGRDADGAVVKPGIFFVQLEGGGTRSVARVALVR